MSRYHPSSAPARGVIAAPISASPAAGAAHAAIADYNARRHMPPMDISAMEPVKSLDINAQPLLYHRPTGHRQLRFLVARYADTISKLFISSGHAAADEQSRLHFFYRKPFQWQADFWLMLTEKWPKQSFICRASRSTSRALISFGRPLRRLDAIFEAALTGYARTLFRSDYRDSRGVNKLSAGLLASSTPSRTSSAP